MFATIALLLSTAAAPQSAPPPAPTRCAAGRVADRLQGEWAGPFTGADWIFRFTCENGVWTGRYISSKGKNWHPLLGLTVAGDAVSFMIESRPQVTFKLRLDGGAGMLSGDVDIGGLHTLPFAATRKA